MVRSVLVTEIFQKATKVRMGFDNDSAALTLMSTDMERINVGLRPVHDIWASIIQVALASWMLYNQLGVVFVAPMGVVALCSIGLVILMNFTGDSQRGWMAGVQKRVGLTATVIANMKNLKISGLSDAVGDFVQKLRVEELAAGTRFRRIYIVAALFGFTPLLIGPPLTFAFAQRTLDVSRIFTSLSWLLLLTNPLSHIFQSIPEVLSGLACLGRIQAFLESEDRHEFRQVLADAEPVDVVASSDSEPQSAHPVIIKNGSFGWEADKFVLRDINTRVSNASLTIVVGPVGSGKSTLCKTLLGEIPFNEGTVTLGNEFRHVGFCDQTAFLSNGSVRDNIVGFSAFNEDRYADVIRATSLDFDFATLPQGDRTNIGSDGITLSGGQKQRVSLARALYLQTNLLVLDDVFSGLDADTEEQVFRQVFGPDGLLRRRSCTVVLCTHSIKHIPAADYIIALGDGTIAEQGSYSQLIARQGYIQRLGLSGSLDSSASSEKSTSEKSVRETDFKSLHATTTDTSALEPETDILRQVGDKTVYKHYFKSMGLVLAASSLLFAALFGFFTNFPTICELYVFRRQSPRDLKNQHTKQ
jgi:ABC-type bacteriocin/lantibiotic exporter with double-glycine peptidase domain